MMLIVSDYRNCISCAEGSEEETNKATCYLLSGQNDEESKQRLNDIGTKQ
jgi:hypothetical protein